jgi:hypothetical protein
MQFPPQQVMPPMRPMDPQMMNQMQGQTAGIRLNGVANFAADVASFESLQYGTNLSLHELQKGEASTPSPHTPNGAGKNVLQLLFSFDLKVETDKKAMKEQISDIVVKILAKYMKQGRIATKEDFKHLARKLTHQCIEKGKKHGNVKTEVSRFLLLQNWQI